MCNCVHRLVSIYDFIPLLIYYILSTHNTSRKETTSIHMFLSFFQLSEKVKECVENSEIIIEPLASSSISKEAFKV